MNIGERQHLDSGVEAGIEYATLHAPLFGAVNGYIRLPKDHPWRALEDIQSSGMPDVDVSGGITYGVDSGGWIGFDTLHAGDYWPGSMFGPDEGDKHWTPEMVADEARSLARQAAAALEGQK